MQFLRLALDVGVSGIVRSESPRPCSGCLMCARFCVARSVGARTLKANARWSFAGGRSSFLRFIEHVIAFHRARYCVS
eukprot:2143898-Rhodomonas_salina.1